MKTCKCVSEVNKLLAERNTKIVVDLFSGIPALMVEKRDSNVRGRPSLVVANYCPFCGRKYATPGEKG